MDEATSAVKVVETTNPACTNKDGYVAEGEGASLAGGGRPSESMLLE